MTGGAEMIDIPRIRAFLVAAECLNFTEAARRLYITQPALSKQVALIEADLGFKLFTRTNRNVALTPEGLYLYDRMRRAVDEIDSSVLLARTAGRGEDGTLRVACFEALSADDVVTGLMLRFRELCPRADLQMEFCSFQEMRERLNSGRADVIITKEFDTSGILQETHVPLFQSEPVVAVGEQHPLAGRESLSIAELSDCSFITISPAESLGAYNRLYSCCHVASFPPNITRYVDRYNELFFYLRLEPCVAIVDRCDVAAAGDGVKAVPLEGFSSLSTVAAWRRDRDNPCMAYFRRALEDVCQENAAEN